MESCLSKIMDIQVKSYFERKNKFMKKIKYVIALCLGMMLLFGNALSCFAATESGTYPTRKGTILVTPDAYRNLIPTGHAAIVLSKSQVVEALIDGVGVHKNNWKTKKKKIYGVSVKGTTTAQDASAANWCKKQAGKSYNFNYFNINTRKKFYCSQLIYAAFLDKYNVNLNTSAYKTPLGNPIHPMEIVNSSNTYTFYQYKK